MFSRFYGYIKKHFQLLIIANSLTDSRKRPLIPTSSIFWFIFIIFIIRLKSLNSMDEFRIDKDNKKNLEKLINGRFPSADTVSYVLKIFDITKLRQAIHFIYTSLQRRHVIAKFRIGGYLVLAIDGHELFSSRHRHCRNCSTRVISTRKGDVIEYYHREVIAYIVGGIICIPLDTEHIAPGEDEVAAASRLFKRIINTYPKAFDVVTVDGLYLRAPFIHLVRSHGKEVVCVLKDEKRDLYTDSQSIFKLQKPNIRIEENNRYERWDEEDFTSWTQLGFPIRVVRSNEYISKANKVVQSDWIWATTLSKKEADTEDICKMGHHRWDIENQGFNEAVNFYNIDRCFVHDSVAIEALLLIFFLAYIMHKAFYFLNIKNSYRSKYTLQYFVLLIKSELIMYVCPCRSP
jgi:Transposase DDE domain